MQKSQRKILSGKKKKSSPLKYALEQLTWHKQVPASFWAVCAHFSLTPPSAHVPLITCKRTVSHHFEQLSSCHLMQGLENWEIWNSTSLGVSTSKEVLIKWIVYFFFPNVAWFKRKMMERLLFSCWFDFSLSVDIWRCSVHFYCLPVIE